MTFTVFDILAWMIVYLNYFIVAKILTWDKTFYLKEGIYTIMACLLMAVSAVISNDVFNVGSMISNIVSILLCVVYFHIVKSYPIKKVTTLVFIIVFLRVINDVFVMIILDFFFPSYLSSIPNFPQPVGLSFSDTMQFVPYILLTIIFSAMATLLFKQITKKQRDFINKNDTAQKVLAYISVFIIATMVIVTNAWLNLGAVVEFLHLTVIPLLGIAIATLFGAIFYARSLHEQTALRQKKAEQEILQQYTEHIEQQQSLVSKMQHDIGNILSSIEGYLDNNDIDGLKEYFYQKIKVTTANVTDNNPILIHLANIKIPEIKAILAAKLTIALTTGIDTTFEAPDVIDNIPMDSLALVRMLGIIMDNAIEELTALRSGRLMVACYISGDGVTFVVQNTCRPDIQKLYALEQVGFSTKGTGRGHGLNNLAEIVATYPENITLHTNIKDGDFTQKLRIHECVNEAY